MISTKVADASVANTSLFRSVVLLAPLGSVISPESTVDSAIAVQIVSAEIDDILPRQYHLQPILKVAPQAILTQASGAGHFSFVAPVMKKWSDQLGEVSKDPAGFDRTKFNAQLGTDLVTWFNNTLQ
ncbi:MAG: hypothetical protein WA888_01305 [Burkholderiaceae bacterium]